MCGSELTLSVLGRARSTPCDKRSRVLSVGRWKHMGRVASVWPFLRTPHRDAEESQRSILGAADLLATLTRTASGRRGEEKQGWWEKL